MKKQFLARCPIEGDTDEWVEKNVLPQLEGLEETNMNYSYMLKNFMEWYKENKENSDVIVHMGLPVEARLFLDAHKYGFIGDWDAPYPLIDISAFPEISGSADTYNKDHGIQVPEFTGGTHNPLYDSVAAALAYRDVLRNWK